ncbi:MAG: ribbon-helix-helix domain-containing protein [Candidatus Micrarchaeaceae archaeon]
MTRKAKVSASIEQEDLERIEDLSRETGKSISSIVCMAVKEFLEKRREGGKGVE